jgi:membrane protein required for colicin V production
MIIDIIFIVLMAMAVFKGYSKGLIVAVFTLLAYIIGLVAALKLSATVAKSLESKTHVSSSWLPVLSFVIVFIAVILLVRLGASLIKKIASVALLGWVDTLAGILLYAFIYTFVYSVVLFYAANIHLISPETQAASKTFDIISPFGPKVIGWIGKLIPFFSHMFSDLSHFFQNVSSKGG